MLNSLGTSEIIIIVIITALFYDSKQISTTLKWWKQLRSKLSQWQFGFEEQVQKIILTAEENTVKTAENWRQEMRQKLGNAPDYLLETYGLAISNQLETMPEYQNAATVCAFYPLGTEPDIKPFLKKTISDGKSLYLPRLIGPGQMEMVLIKNPDEDLEKSTLGFLQPRSQLNEVLNNPPDLCLVPGLAFGLKGERIGRGKGCYDRWLAANKPLKTVGVLFEMQLVRDSLPQRDTDVPMHMLFTEKRTIDIEQRKTHESSVSP